MSDREGNRARVAQFYQINPEKKTTLTIRISEDIHIKEEFNELMEITGLTGRELLKVLMDSFKKPKTTKKP